MTYVIPAPAQASVAVSGGGAFPVRRIFCVGRNYAAHIREMGNDTREPPFFFTKPADAVVATPGEVAYPMGTEDLHHEIELVVAIGTGGREITEAEAPAHIWGAGVGVDLTRRDLQAAAKKMGRPWDMAKGFDASAPMGALRPLGPDGAPDAGRIWLSVNDEIRQDADLGDMIWSVPETIAALSRLVALAPGDLIMTGTPAGVGPLNAGDRVAGGIAGLEDLRFDVI